MAVSTKDLAIFTRQFATMISAGLPLVQCLDILAKQSSKPSFGRVIAEVTREVEAGSTLSDALGKHKAVFDDLFRNMVAAGEAGGVLDEILMRLATYIEKADALKRKVQSAHGLPGGGAHRSPGRHVVHAHLHHPDVRQDVHGLRRRAAAADQDRARHVEHPAALLVGAALLAHRRRRHLRSSATTPPRTASATSTASMLTHARCSGDVLLKGAVARFTRTLGTLIASGVPILAGLEITGAHRRQQDHRRSDHDRARLDPRGRDGGGAAQGLRGVPADGRRR